MDHGQHTPPAVPVVGSEAPALPHPARACHGRKGGGVNHALLPLSRASVFIKQLQEPGQAFGCLSHSA